MISADTQAIIEKFNIMVKRAIQANSKDVRMNISDATILVGELSNVMARLAVLENAKATNNTTTMADGHHFDGGKF